MAAGVPGTGGSISRHVGFPALLSSVNERPHTVPSSQTIIRRLPASNAAIGFRATDSSVASLYARNIEVRTGAPTPPGRRKAPQKNGAG
jgi:hypothetical protein